MYKISAVVSLALVAGCTVSAGTSGPHAPSYAGPSSPPPPPSVAPATPCSDPGPGDVTDLFDQAAALAPSSTTVFCTVRQDVDMFTVAVPPGAGGTLVRYAIGGGPDTTVHVEVYDAHRKKGHADQGRKGEEVRGWLHVAGGTAAFLRVAGNANAESPYTIALTAEPITEPTEPNGSFEMATALPESGGDVTAFLARPFNDPGLVEDWYRVELTRPGPFTVDVDMSQDVAPRVDLFDQRRKRLRVESGQKGERIQLARDLPAGVYYIKVDANSHVHESAAGEPMQHVVRPYRITTSR